MRPGNLLRRKPSTKSISSNNSNTKDQPASTSSVQKPLLSDFDTIVVPKINSIKKRYKNLKRLIFFVSFKLRNFISNINNNTNIWFKFGFYI